MNLAESKKIAERMDCPCRGERCGGLGCKGKSVTYPIEFHGGRKEFCKHYKCRGCDVWTPWALGGTDDATCDDCWAKAHPAETRATVKKTGEVVHVSKGVMRYMEGIDEPPAKSVEQLLDDGNAFGALMLLLKECGAQVTLYGKPITESDLRTHIDQRVDQKAHTALSAMFTGRPVCANYAPPGHAGHWREWHRGHGCNLDPNP